MKKPTFNLSLSQRDWSILRFVQRHRLITFQVLHHLFFDGLAIDAVKSTLRRLVARYRLLTAERLDVRRGYYRLTQRGVALLGGKSPQVGPLGPQAILERFAILWFIAVDRPGRRTLINPKEFPEQFALGPQRLPRANFYIEEDEQGRRWFGYIVVDHGGHVRRIVSKTVRVVARFLKRGWFEEFFASGRFVVTVLTLSGAKQKSLQFGLNAQMQTALRYALSRFEHPRPLVTEVAVVPGLMELIPGPMVNVAVTRAESSSKSVVTSTTDDSEGDLS